MFSSRRRTNLDEDGRLRSVQAVVEKDESVRFLEEEMKLKTTH